MGLSGRQALCDSYQLNARITDFLASTESDRLTPIVQAKQGNHDGDA